MQMCLVHGALDALAKSQTNQFMHLQKSKSNSDPRRLLNPLQNIWLLERVRDRYSHVRARGGKILPIQIQ